MTTDIFLRSYAADLPWVPFALKSIHKFVTGIRNIIIVVPVSDYDRFKALNFTLEILCSSRFEPFRDDYLGQQCDKLHAHLYSHADYILFWDSDVIATRPFSPSDLLIYGKPRWLVTPYSKLIKADGSPDVPWQPITEKAICHQVEVETMRAHPLMAPTEALRNFRKFMEFTHGMSLQEYIASRPNREFSEWNALGAWGFYYAPQLFSFWHTDVSVPEPFVKQFWSWGGLTPEIRAEMDRLLS